MYSLQRPGQVVLVLLAVLAIGVSESRAQPLPPITRYDLPGLTGPFGGYGPAAMSTAPWMPGGGPDCRQLAPQDALALTLTAGGIDNQNGRLLWPLGLAVLGTRHAETLRQRIEALLHIAALQAQSGRVEPQTGAALTQAIEELRYVFQTMKRRVVMARPTIVNARRYLSRLEQMSGLLGMLPDGTPRHLGPMPR